MHLYFTFARVQIEKTAPSSDERIGSDIIQIRMYAQIIQPPTTETNYFSDLETRTRILNYVKQRKLSRWFLYCVLNWSMSVSFNDLL